MIPISSATIGFIIRSALNSERAEETLRALSGGEKKRGRWGGGEAFSLLASLESCYHSTTNLLRHEAPFVLLIKASPTFGRVNGGGIVREASCHGRTKAARQKASRINERNIIAGGQKHEAALQKHPEIPIQWHHPRMFRKHTKDKWHIWGSGNCHCAAAAGQPWQLLSDAPTARPLFV